VVCFSDIFVTNPRKMVKDFFVKIWINWLWNEY